MDNYSNAPQIQNMDLNQAVTEYYFDDKNAHLPALTLAPIERKQLDDLLWEFNKVTGDEFDRYKQLDPVPYVQIGRGLFCVRFGEKGSDQPVGALITRRFSSATYLKERADR